MRKGQVGTFDILFPNHVFIQNSKPIAIPYITGGTIGIKTTISLTITHNEWTVGRGDYRNYYKGHMDKIKGEGGGGGGRGVQLGWGGGVGRKAYNCN